MARKLKNILVTGGCGFIGSNFINYLLGKSESDEACFKDSGFTGRIVNVDCLTYAGNPENLKAVEENYVSDDQMHSLMEWRKGPQKWSDAHSV